MKEFNIFSNLLNSFYFVIVIIAEFAIQWVILTFGGIIFRTSPLPFTMYITSVAIAASVLAVGALVKFMNEEFVKKHFAFKFLELSEAEKREIEKAKTPKKSAKIISPVKSRENALRE